MYYHLTSSWPELPVHVIYCQQDEALKKFLLSADF